MDILSYIGHHLIGVLTKFGKMEVENLDWLLFDSIITTIVSRLPRISLPRLTSILAASLLSVSIWWIDWDWYRDQGWLSLAIFARIK